MAIAVTVMTRRLGPGNGRASAWAVTQIESIMKHAVKPGERYPVGTRYEGKALWAWPGDRKRVATKK